MEIREGKKIMDYGYETRVEEKDIAEKKCYKDWPSMNPGLPVSKAQRASRDDKFSKRQKDQVEEKQNLNQNEAWKYQEIRIQIDRYGTENENE